MSRRCPAAPDLCARVTCLASSLRNRDGHIPTLDECDRMTDAELIGRLISIKGIGRWTAEMLLIFNLGRPEMFCRSTTWVSGRASSSPTEIGSCRSLTNSPDTASGGHRTAQRQRGICGGPQISWMGMAGEQVPATTVN